MTMKIIVINDDQSRSANIDVLLQKDDKADITESFDLKPGTHKEIYIWKEKSLIIKEV